MAEDMQARVMLIQKRFASTSFGLPGAVALASVSCCLRVITTDVKGHGSIGSSEECSTELHASMRDGSSSLEERGSVESGKDCSCVGVGVSKGRGSMGGSEGLGLRGDREGLHAGTNDAGRVTPVGRIKRPDPIPCMEICEEKKDCILHVDITSFVQHTFRISSPENSCGEFDLNWI